MADTDSARAGHDRQSGGRTSLPLFFRQVMAELRKVVWPTRDQLSTYFVVVLVFVLFMIAFVSVLDLVFAKGAFAVFG